MPNFWKKQVKICNKSLYPLDGYRAPLDGYRASLDGYRASLGL